MVVSSFMESVSSRIEFSSTSPSFISGSSSKILFSIFFFFVCHFSVWHYMNYLSLSLVIIDKCDSFPMAYQHKLLSFKIFSLLTNFVTIFIFHISISAPIMPASSLPHFSAAFFFFCLAFCKAAIFWHLMSQDEASMISSLLSKIKGRLLL